MRFCTCHPPPRCPPSPVCRHCWRGCRHPPTPSSAVLRVRRMVLSGCKQAGETELAAGRLLCRRVVQHRRRPLRRCRRKADPRCCRPARLPAVRQGGLCHLATGAQGGRLWGASDRQKMRPLGARSCASGLQAAAGSESGAGDPGGTDPACGVASLGWKKFVIFLGALQRSRLTCFEWC